MILEKVQLVGFRSIQSPIDFWIHPDVTCLVGANEHGKTNLLESVTFLNNDDNDYEDRDKNQSYKPKSYERTPGLTFFFSLNKDDVTILKDRLEAEIQQMESPPAGENVDNQKKRENLLAYCREVVNRLKTNRKHELQVHVKKGWYKWFTCDGTKLCTRENASSAVYEYLNDEFLPQVKYFEASNELPDSISLAELDADGNWEFKGLLKMAGVWDRKEDLFENDIAARKLLTSASRKLTREIRSVWSQGRGTHTFHLNVNDGKLCVDIEDKTGTYDSPANRSLGFRSFFSFYLSIYAQTDSFDPSGFIFIFDEPGIHLHPQGQKDLLRELRRMGRANQIIYSTHSPFMIDRNDVTRTQVVKKGVGAKDKGTRIINKASRGNWGPVRDSLGIMMNDSFFYADVSLLVEGTSDRIFIGALLNLVAPVLDVDLNFVSIIDADKRKEMAAMSRILLAEDRKLVALTDSDDGGKEIADAIKKTAKSMKKTENQQSIDINGYMPKTRRGMNSIEDILPIEQLVEAVNLYANSGLLKKKHTFTQAEIEACKNGEALSRGLAKLFKEKELIDDTDDFSKTTLASFFSDVIAKTELSKITDLENQPFYKFCAALKELLFLQQ